MNGMQRGWVVKRQPAITGAFTLRGYSRMSTLLVLLLEIVLEIRVGE